MTKYVALLRGIGPGNPNMRGEKLREFFEDLGFTNVTTVISSGNVLFESKTKDIEAIESRIEHCIPEKLGFESTTIIRSQEEIQDFVNKNPFKEMEDSRSSKLNVTFLKKASKITIPDGTGYRIVKSFEREICFSINLASTKTPDVMLKMEKTYGKQITTRTWKTVMRIISKM